MLCNFLKYFKAFLFFFVFAKLIWLQALVLCCKEKVLTTLWMFLRKPMHFWDFGTSNFSILKKTCKIFFWLFCLCLQYDAFTLRQKIKRFSINTQQNWTDNCRLWPACRTFYDWSDSTRPWVDVWRYTPLKESNWAQTQSSEATRITAHLHKATRTSRFCPPVSAKA